MAQLLRQRGWSILAQRWRSEAGEVDLIVEREARLRFVEVKLRQADDPVGLECIDDRKLARLRGAGEQFLADWPHEIAEACLLVALVEPLGDSYDIQLFDDPD